MIGRIRRWHHRRRHGHDPEWIGLILSDDPDAVALRVCRVCWIRAIYADEYAGR